MEIPIFNVNNYHLLEPLNTVQVKKNYKDFTLKNNQLPLGNYEICLYLINDKDGRQLAFDCYSLDLLNFLPPYLIAPADKDIVRIKTPFFFWSPASPNLRGNQYEYTLLMTEVLYAQSPVAAIKKNPYWIRNSGILTPSFCFLTSSKSSIFSGLII